MQLQSIIGWTSNVILSFTGFGFVLEIKVSRDVCLRLEKLFAGMKTKWGRIFKKMPFDLTFVCWISLTAGLVDFSPLDCSPVSQELGTTYNWWMPWFCMWELKLSSSSMEKAWLLAWALLLTLHTWTYSRTWQWL